jgi:tetratricopeptide (TPR) repeat protein
MNAVVSGHAGVALLLEGQKLSSLHADRPGQVFPRSTYDVPFLLGEAKDLEFLEAADLVAVSHRLDLATNKVDALHLALILLDGTLSAETRSTAAEELEELLQAEDVRIFVERILHAQPLPRGVDLAGALVSCSGATSSALELLAGLEALQGTITEVYVAWEQVPSDLFEEKDDKAYVQSIAVREGFFHDLVALRMVAGSIDAFQVKALLNSSYRAIRNHRDILRAWLVPLRLDRSPRHRYLDHTGANDPEMTADASPSLREGTHLPNRGAHLLKRVERQKAAIVNAMKQRRLDRVREYVEDLIGFQLENGDPVYACMSLCDLAMKAKGQGLHKLQLELTFRAVKLKNNDGWSWTQHGDALLRNGQLAKALEAYNQALLYTKDVEAKAGRAEVLKAQNRLDEALSAYELVIAEFPENAAARNGRVEVLKAQNRLDEALSVYERLVEREIDLLLAA